MLQLTASVTRRVADLSLEAGYMRTESSNLRIGGFRATTWDRNLPLPTRFDEFGRVLNAGNNYADSLTQAILGSPNFRARNRTLGPRLAQLGIRFDF